MAIGLQLLLDDVQVSHRILGSSVHEMNQQPGTFDMTQKVVAKTSALGGPFNQAWYVCKNSAISTGPAHQRQVAGRGQFVGAMMAAEAVKLITGAGHSLRGEMLIYDALYGESRKIAVSRRPDCPICGDKGERHDQPVAG